MDADYCINSIIQIGTSDTWTTHQNIIINGIHGRACISKVYNTDSDTEPTATDIIADTLDKYSLISIADKTTVNGMTVTCGKAGGANPLDEASKYLTPNIYLSSGANSKVLGVQFIVSDGDVEFTKDWLLKKFNSLSTYTDNMNISINCSNGTLYLKRSGSTVSVSKNTIETIE